MSLGCFARGEVRDERLQWDAVVPFRRRALNESRQALELKIKGTKMQRTTSEPTRRPAHHAGAAGVQLAERAAAAGMPAPPDVSGQGAADELPSVLTRAVIAGHWPVSFCRQERNPAPPS